MSLKTLQLSSWAVGREALLAGDIGYTSVLVSSSIRSENDIACLGISIASETPKSHRLQDMHAGALLLIKFADVWHEKVSTMVKFPRIVLPSRGPTNTKHHDGTGVTTISDYPSS